MRWDERIDRMERSGIFGNDDRKELGDFTTCLVGEALRDANAPTYFHLPDGEFAERLRQLGLGSSKNGYEHGPFYILYHRDWNGLRARLAEIRALVSEHYPPPQVPIGALEEVRELVTA